MFTTILVSFWLLLASVNLGFPDEHVYQVFTGDPLEDEYLLFAGDPDEHEYGVKNECPVAAAASKSPVH